MRLLFAGTPEAALPSLRTLLDSHHEVVGVLTQPDARTGRGRKLRPSPVKTLALEAGIPVLTPATLRDRSEEHTSELQSRFDLVCRLLLEKKKNDRTSENYIC